MTQDSAYPFWDLITEEAYLPEDASLLENGCDAFREDAGGEEKRLWLFGCNAACREVIRQGGLGGVPFRVAGILDNASSRQGKMFCGVPVFMPKEIVPTLHPKKDIVVIVLRLHADAVAKQLRKLGFFDIYSLGVLLADLEPYRSFVEELVKLKQKPVQDDLILMESMNDFDGNTGALYGYLKENKTKYRFVWIVKNPNAKNPYADDGDKVLCPNNVDDLKEYMRLRATAKWEIWECDPIRKVRDDQINVFLQHYGMGYKQVAHIYSSPPYVDFALTTNPFVQKMESMSITYAKETRFIYGELPRNDVLYGNNRNELSKITSGTYRKVVLWAPTLRESRYYQRIDSDIAYPFGISLIYSDEDMKLLDKYLVKREMLLILKPHPRQRLNYAYEDYENILYLTGERARAVHPYKLLTQIDALITDYSSIVFDYMLLDRPCAWVLEDREHYKIEYLMENPETYMPGDKIYTMEDLFRFLSDVCEGKDTYRKERRNIRDLCNPPFEGKGCERLAEALGL